MAYLSAVGLLNTGQGKRFASGTFTPASSVTNVSTGLATVDACWVTFHDPQVINHTEVMGEPGTQDDQIQVQCRKPTGTGDLTPVASSGEHSKLTWMAIGT